MNGMNMKLLVMGAPGAGKGTICELLNQRLHVPHISMGDLLRAHVHKKDELGKQIAPVLAHGDFVPDELTIQIINHRLTQADAKNSFLLDGYPRTLFQAEELSKVTQLTGIILVTLPDEVIIQRLSKRLICPVCNTIYHETSMPPRVAGVCDHDKEKLVHRSDDEPQTIKERLTTYHEKTQPLIDFFKKKDVPFLDIPGDYDVATQSDAILEKIIAWQKAV
jgi:adenylate kinase